MSDDVLKDDWKNAWQPVIDAIGQDVSIGELAAPADAIDASALRRYLEPLEFGCALHHDPTVARAHGYPDTIVPYTAMITYTMAPMWKPGDPTLFPIAERDAQPERSAVKPVYPNYFPEFTGYFGTDVGFDFSVPRPLRAQGDTGRPRRVRQVRIRNRDRDR